MVTFFIVAAWLDVSNHCALGELLEAGETPSVHEKSPGRPAPAKEHDDDDAACCTTLKAVTPAKVAATPNTLDYVLKDFTATAILFQLVVRSPQGTKLDTGPPGAVSFSESVLQRSLLAHAPPVFLS